MLSHLESQLVSATTCHCHPCLPTCSRCSRSALACCICGRKPFSRDNTAATRPGQHSTAQHMTWHIASSMFSYGRWGFVREGGVAYRRPTHGQLLLLLLLLPRYAYTQHCCACLLSTAAHENTITITYEQGRDGPAHAPAPAPAELSNWKLAGGTHCKARCVCRSAAHAIYCSEVNQ